MNIPEAVALVHLAPLAVMSGIPQLGSHEVGVRRQSLCSRLQMKSEASISARLDDDLDISTLDDSGGQASWAPSISQDKYELKAVVVDPADDTPPNSKQQRLGNLSQLAIDWAIVDCICRSYIVQACSDHCSGTDF